MISSRPHKTLADYVAVALCPLLIMLLVGSLAFFLLEIGYEGRWADRLRWALFWFVIASVLVSRISIERGPNVAALYGAALGAATSLFIFRFMGFVISVLCLLAFIWWCTSKLTWDCTLIDDDEDASGEGLLQAAGIDETPPDGSDSQQRKGSGRKWWQRLLQNRGKRSGQSHAPGLWVVYFSLAALPVFGFGQLLLHGNEADSRRYGFQLLWVYVAAALGLLLTTSFLGLRRYLRQRRLRMPASIAASWIGLGTALALGVLLLCLILPRPDGKYTITRAVDEISSTIQKASEHAMVPGEAGEGEGRRIGRGEVKDSGESKQKEPSQGKGKTDKQGGEGTAGGKESKQKSGGGGAGSNQKQGERTDQGAPGGDKDGKGSSLQASGKDAGTSSPELKPSANWIGSLVKWLIYGLIVLVALFIAFRKRQQLAVWWRRLLKELRDFWNRLFGRKISVATANAGTQILASSGRSFSDYENPFDSGAAHERHGTELVVYSFEALQVWASEHEAGRGPEQTPMEFAQALGSAVPAISAEAREVSRLYTRLAYAKEEPLPECREALSRLWREMEVGQTTEAAFRRT